MRINCKTLDNLLDGMYNSAIAKFTVIDCRFDYEYNGGHIPGAININTTTAVEEFLLGPNLQKPKPSVSGDSNKKTILVFHCEFSAKRAPTFAKHLRARDRAMNNHFYPKIYYPEVYILEGGYCQYFKTSAHRCLPPAYVRMDDPKHLASRREDLDQFRKVRFGRNKSVGDVGGKTALPQPPKRNIAPSVAPNSLFAAANATRSHRCGGPSLMSLAEDANVAGDADDTDTDIGDSPCPPPNKTSAFKSKKLGRAPLARAETYGPIPPHFAIRTSGFPMSGAVHRIF
jgi:M-phase inducer tyrosine phosphatase